MQNRTTGIRPNRGLTELNIFIYLLKIRAKVVNVKHNSYKIKIYHVRVK